MKLNELDDSKYILAIAAIIGSLSKDNLLSELGRCYPNFFDNDIMQILITTCTMFIFVRNAKISVEVALGLYIFINLIHTLTGRTDCGSNIDTNIKDIKNSFISNKK